LYRQNQKLSELTMASDRQIAANRRNASRSTGPRSRGGKQRAGRNAYRHGLSISSIATCAPEVEGLARKIAGDTDNEIILERARAAACAELDLARVRRVKIALIERMRAFGDLDLPRLRVPSSVTKLIEHLNALARGVAPPEILPIDKAATMPSQEPDRSAEAIRRALPELLKLDRYERRAIARRDQAVRDLVKVERRSFTHL
jgi:hypothetical protein